MAQIIENNDKRIPTIILKVIKLFVKILFLSLSIQKGTGWIANQLASTLSPAKGQLEVFNTRSSNRRLLSGKDFHQLSSIKDDKNNVIFICQLGKNQLDECILQAIGSGR